MCRICVLVQRSQKLKSRPQELQSTTQFSTAILHSQKEMSTQDTHSQNS